MATTDLAATHCPPSGLQPESGQQRPACGTEVPAQSPAGPEPADRRFGGVERVYGADAAERIRGARVAVVGLGGVGSWAAEALARCGVGVLCLIDMDHVAESNINRQLHALEETLGAAKVDVMARRLQAINPRISVEVVDDFIDSGNAARYLQDFSVVVDCIDNAGAKAALIDWCRRSRQPVVCCGAAGGRLDPTRIRSADLASATGDALLASVRQRLRRDYGFPAASEGEPSAGRRASPGRPVAFGVTAIFSPEQPATGLVPVAGGPATNASPGAPLACAGYGSTVVVTAPFGFVAAAQALAIIAA